MYSKIVIDVDDQMRPIIRIEYKYSEDLRDKMVKMFLEQFDGTASYTTLHYESSTGNQVAILSPVKAEDIDKHAELLTKWVKKREPANMMTKEEFDSIRNSAKSEK